MKRCLILMLAVVVPTPAAISQNESGALAGDLLYSSGWSGVPAPPGGAPQRSTPVDAFLGRWDITVTTPSGEYPSWIEVSLKDGKPAAEMVGRSGNSFPVPRVEIQQDRIEFGGPQGFQGRKNGLLFTGRLEGNRIVGTTAGGEGAPWHWTAVRAPRLDRGAPPKWGNPVVLFDGKDLADWRLQNPAGDNGWSVEQGIMTNRAPSSNLVTRQRFTDFKLHVEFNCPRNCNSGVYLRGRYEVQIEDDSLGEPPSHHTGGIYGFLAPEPELTRRPGEWQSFDITLVGRRVTVVQNGRIIINDREIPGITGGALDSHEEMPGPIYLQGDHGSLSFRNIVITPAL
jgi:hypothetical protein